MATLMDTDDAMIWAEEFCRIFNGKMIAADELSSALEHGPVTPGTMVGWFANAMQVAVNLAEERRLHAAGELTPAEQFLKDWEESHPEPVDDDVRDEEKQAFVEGFEEGRPE